MKNTPKIDLEHTHTRFISKRIDKTLNWLLTSRDVWKEKCLKAKLELKMRTLSVKRLQDGRNKWKDQSKQVAKVIQQMEDTREHYLKEIDNLKKVLNKKNDEIENLKKKS